MKRSEELRALEVAADGLDRTVLWAIASELAALREQQQEHFELNREFWRTMLEAIVEKMEVKRAE